MGDAAGLDFHLDRVARAVNTTDAHGLVLWAGERDRAPDMARVLFAAYFTEGRDVGDAGELVALAGEVGLDPEDARDVLTSSRFEAAWRKAGRRPAASA
jgi:predicted DsbA family dithiol-disulfide isomerase